MTVDRVIRDFSRIMTTVCNLMILSMKSIKDFNFLTTKMIVLSEVTPKNKLSGNGNTLEQKILIIQLLKFHGWDT